MSNRTLSLDDALYHYLLANGVRESDTLRRLRDETMTLEMSAMQIAPEQGQFMTLLVELLSARRIIEVGTFTGYSALAMASRLPPDGQLIACDVSAEWTDIGRRYWREAGVDDRIDLRLAPALETLDALLDEGQAGGFDIAFIDADKENYLNYYQRCYRLVRTGGLIMVDNTLWDGSVVDPADNDRDTVAIRGFNAYVREDDRVSISMVPIGDGLTLLRKRIADSGPVSG